MQLKTGLLCGFLSVMLSSCCTSHLQARRLVGSRMPPVEDSDDILFHLRREPNDSLGLISRSFGFLTTPFKRIGFFGWQDTGFRVCSRGIVRQAASSTDGFRTFDMSIDSIEINGRSAKITRLSFIRVELCTRDVCRPPHRVPDYLEAWRLCGRLLWDSDPEGWFEIHPQSEDDVQFVVDSIGSPPPGASRR